MAIEIKSRKEGTRQKRKKILIVCEGAKTEPAYFNSFRVATHVCEVKGIGDNTISLVKRAKEIKEESSDYSEVWCVFDRDSFPKKNVNNALNLAKTLGYNCAFSNESFELWYVLHFCYLDTKISRADYCKRLSTHLKSPYKKNDASMYESLKKLQDVAIKNAKKLEASVCTPGLALCDATPFTTVYKLVEKLNKLERKIFAK